MTRRSNRAARVARVTATVGSALLAGVSGLSVPLAAQPPAIQAPALAAGVVREVGRARALVEAGAGAEARALLDSLVREQASGSNELAEALFWRATLAERASESERDWKRLTIEAPLSPRTADALVRLGEFEMLRGRPATARPYFERVIQDFPGTPQRAKGALWIVRGWFDERNSANACAALATVPATSVPDGELRLQYDELGRRCAVAVGTNGGRGATPAAAPAATPAMTPAAAPAAVPGNTSPGAATAPAAAKPPTDGARFSVQLAAYDTRAEADASVKRLKAGGIDARVDGEVKPFRVRTGRYATRAEAAAALAKLKRQGQGGFVAELRP